MSEKVCRAQQPNKQKADRSRMFLVDPGLPAVSDVAWTRCATQKCSKMLLSYYNNSTHKAPIVNITFSPQSQKEYVQEASLPRLHSQQDGHRTL